MKLMDMLRDLPRRAGMANLYFTNADFFGSPIREGAKIVLPLHPRAEFHSLQNGRQFLFLSATKPSECWFGGTDEKPFLAQLREPALTAFCDSGENGFFASLKPGIVHDLEKGLGVVALRQGDIFAVPLPLDEKHMGIVSHLHCWKWEDADDFRVFGTRHKLTGEYSDDVAVRGGFRLLATGVLEAPDHKPLRLEKVHLLAQADNLYNSRMAD